ncbi:hypothetical protein BLA29_009330 [Euroglyphus maynei]|uniref:Uncharacterized protein n=1 Tax=Euroglyphus maynei TaxID=6958 RepID=A0A1Y3BE92_EURMA|nr:hypothetical protein BLA29_009330 [Euroglyphus maynei]
MSLEFLTRKYFNHHRFIENYHHRSSLIMIIWCILLSLIILSSTMFVDAFIFWKAKTTACDICDGIDTYSGRNVMCCFLSSKCCGATNIDDLETARFNMTTVPT